MIKSFEAAIKQLEKLVTLSNTLLYERDTILERENRFKLRDAIFKLADTMGYIAIDLVNGTFFVFENEEALLKCQYNSDFEEINNILGFSAIDTQYAYTQIVRFISIVVLDISTRTSIYNNRLNELKIYYIDESVKNSETIDYYNKNYYNKNFCYEDALKNIDKLEKLAIDFNKHGYTERKRRQKQMKKLIVAISYMLNYSLVFNKNSINIYRSPNSLIYDYVSKDITWYGGDQYSSVWFDDIFKYTNDSVIRFVSQLKRNFYSI